MEPQFDNREGHLAGQQKLLVAATGASGMPVLVRCLEMIRQDGRYKTGLIVSRSAKLTLDYETGKSAEQIGELADEVFEPEEIGAGPASGSYPTAGMLVVPCSMKSAAGICSGYTDNLILRGADVTIKEQRPLVLGIRETPLNSIHLRNLLELSRIPNVRIMPLMMTFYNRPESLGDMIDQTAAKLLMPFGIYAKEYQRWTGL